MKSSLLLPEVEYPWSEEATTIEFPDSDGRRMADNTVQFDWIAIIKWNLESQFREVPDVFVAGDHLIYPVSDNPRIRQAPDVFVVFGRPKADRGSYQVFREEGIFPQVVFEVWSPSNKLDEMQDKFDFYQRHGAEEYYYVYAQFPSYVEGWTRQNDRLVRVEKIDDHVSPRLGIRFELKQGNLAIIGQDGRAFLRPDEIAHHWNQSIEEGRVQRFRTEQEKQRADQEKQRADQEKQRADQEKQRADTLRQKLRELGVDPDSL